MSQLERLAEAVVQVGKQSGPVLQSVAQAGQGANRTAASVPNDEAGYSRTIRTQLYEGVAALQDVERLLADFDKRADAFAKRLVGRVESGRGATGVSATRPAGLSALPSRGHVDTSDAGQDSDIKFANQNGWASGEDDYRVNCQKCVTAYELRRRGYDVVAGPTSKGEPVVGGVSVGQRRNYITARWRRSDGTRPGDGGDATFSRREDLDAHVAAWGSGGRGFVMVRWKLGGGGHVFVVENRRGKAYYMDPQSGSLDASTHLRHVAWSRPGGVCVLRTDQLQHSPEDDRYNIEDMVDAS